MNKYRICYDDMDSKKEITVQEFEAENRDEALKILYDYKQHNIAYGKEYYYKRVHVWTLKKEDGTEVEEEFPKFLDEEWVPQTLIEKIKYCGEKISYKWNSLKYKFHRLTYFWDDFKYWFKHYDYLTNTSHMRSECWSVDTHLIEDLAFNVNKIYEMVEKGTCGISDKYLLMAREELKKNNENYTVPEELLKCYSYTDEEFALGRKMWCEELDRFLNTIGLYVFYSYYGHFGDNDYIKYHMYADREYYEKLMPYYEGTKNDIDYDRLKELLDMYWNSIWNWVKENGNQLWI
jgi:hypothetical protein